MTNTFGFELSVSAYGDGTIEAAYISLRPCDAVAKTREIVTDALMADYDAQGKLVGLEILAPVRIADLVQLVEKKKRQPFEKFVTGSIPPELILA